MITTANIYLSLNHTSTAKAQTGLIS